MATIAGRTGMPVRVMRSADFAPGSTIHLRPDLQRAHLFDAGSGKRLAA